MILRLNFNVLDGDITTKYLYANSFRYVNWVMISVDNMAYWSIKLKC